MGTVVDHAMAPRRTAPPPTAEAAGTEQLPTRVVGNRQNAPRCRWQTEQVTEFRRPASRFSAGARCRAWRVLCDPSYLNVRRQTAVSTLSFGPEEFP